MMAIWLLGNVVVVVLIFIRGFTVLNLFRLLWKLLDFSHLLRRACLTASKLVNFKLVGGTLTKAMHWGWMLILLLCIFLLGRQHQGEKSLALLAILI